MSVRTIDLIAGTQSPIKKERPSPLVRLAKMMYILYQYILYEMLYLANVDFKWIHRIYSLIDQVVVK